jgi:GABA permease
MARILVVANKTAESPELLEAMRAKGTEHEYVLVVPASGGMLEKAADPDAARETTEPHLHAALEKMRGEGFNVDGSIGDSDPVAAVQDAANFSEFDEVIISTLPIRVSKWVKLDLPSKAQRATGLPVTHVETKQHD